MSTQSPGSNLPSVWTEAIDRIQKTIALALEDLEHREAALGNLSHQSTAPLRQANLVESIGRSNEWRTTLDRVQQSAVEADTLLHAGEEALRKWLAARETMSRNLAKWDKS